MSSPRFGRPLRQAARFVFMVLRKSLRNCIEVILSINENYLSLLYMEWLGVCKSLSTDMAVKFKMFA